MQTFVKFTAVPVLWIFFRAKVFHQTEASKDKYYYIRGGTIIMGNHTKIWDPIFAGWYFLFRQFRVLAGEMLYKKNKLFSWFLDKMGFIRVDRNVTDLRATQESIDALSQGALLGVYPEGRFNPEPELLPFKPGVVILALRTGAPIVPLFIQSEYKLGKPTYAIVGEKIHLGDYLPVELPYEDGIKWLCDFLRGRMVELQAELGRRISSIEN